MAKKMIGYVLGAEQPGLLESDKAAALRARPAGLNKFVTAFCSEAKCKIPAFGVRCEGGDSYALSLQTAAPKFVRPASGVHGGAASPHSSQPIYSARKSQPTKILLTDCKVPLQLELFSS